MPPSRHLHQPLVSGLGVAGSLLAAVVVTFALASGIVSYGLTSQDPLTTRGSGALVLKPLRPASARPIVLRRARPATTVRRSSLRPAPAASVVVRPRASGDGSLGAQVVGRADRAPQNSGAGAGRPEPVAGVPGRAPHPVDSAVGATTQAVDATTDSLDRGLRAVTERLRTRTAPVVRSVDALLTGGPPPG